MKKRGIVPRPPPTADQIAAMQGQQIAAIQRQMMQSQYIQTQAQPGTITVTTTTVSNTNVVQPIPGPVVVQPNPGLSRAGSVAMQPGPGMPMPQMGQPGVPMNPQQQQPVVGYMQPNNQQSMQLPNVAIGYVSYLIWNYFLFRQVRVNSSIDTASLRCYLRQSKSAAIRSAATTTTAQLLLATGTHYYYNTRNDTNDD
jgi:hypothetical protein